MYKLLLRPILFCFSPEAVHHFTFSAIKFFNRIPLVSGITRSIYKISNKHLETEVAGITFPNPVGLAAGFDKDGKLYNELSNYGFGFIEIGTITPKAQPGNPKPRLFRLKADSGLINRMGFNNEGVEEMVKRLKKTQPKVIIGGNIGKNKVTPNEEAVNDYIICFNSLFDYVDYFVVNVSSPNTPDLRQLQDKEPLLKLLSTLQDLNDEKENAKPIFLKIAPDLNNEQLNDIIDIVAETHIAGIIATNTTISREGLKTDSNTVEAIGNGGLSGKPVTSRSTEVIKYLHTKSNGKFPIIGVGGIHSENDAIEKLEAGASLIQLYTGFIYEGPGLVKRINKKIIEHEANRMP